MICVVYLAQACAIVLVVVPEGPGGMDLTPPPEFFPLPESSAAEVATAIHQACDALERASLLGAKADAFFAASWCISGLQAVHEMLDTPWWVSIMLFNISLRLCTFPLMVLAQRGSAKMMEFNYALLHAKKLQEAAMKATNRAEHDRLFNAFRTEYTAQVSKHGDPVKTALMVPGVMIFNGFVFLSIFNGISKLMAAKVLRRCAVPSLTTGGALWFSDLTQPDPFFGLPIMCTLVTLAMVEYGINLAGDAGPMPSERQQATKTMKWVFRVLAFMFIPAGNYVAAGTALLWVSNTAFGVVQGMLLRNDGVRQRMGLPSMQELREMNARVLEANSANAPKPSEAPPSIFSATKPSLDTAPAVNVPLMSRPPGSKGTKGP
ncbi:hypothetical protein VOLCADRAFT_105325 [Volvox carteri f. nagariensis]|uniref:Membrane insertase YidC/Oxa/ALB C-terminal domain-containing protein n=1 Tax=Volvox carteri f. nagariensis TaxID=3068 RepID=D8U024_VOLCA|nr:uncharacterized protein VOLCADRAFT_105325 [Volvox carteri f. nagariensis]EFJ46792.1 hypothetical protein VOLCADRAFT_105325 [Volvox carteri f. nagariensis]|eukprot:XP_002952001.1 hypothetical protein VOLCADRAFT_105325 [Volvox carteri f. nagariensis]